MHCTMYRMPFSTLERDTGGVGSRKATQGIGGRGAGGRKQQRHMQGAAGQTGAVFLGRQAGQPYVAASRQLHLVKAALMWGKIPTHSVQPTPLHRHGWRLCRASRESGHRRQQHLPAPACHSLAANLPGHFQVGLVHHEQERGPERTQPSRLGRHPLIHWPLEVAGGQGRPAAPRARERQLQRARGQGRCSSAEHGCKLG